MGDTTSNIVITATNKARATLQSVSTDFDHISTNARNAGTAISRAGQAGASGLGSINGALGGAASGFSALSRAIPVAAIGAFVVGAGKAALALAQMGEESVQVEARFRAFVGGGASATAMLNAMDRAVGEAMTKDDQMAAATSLMSQGLAKSADEAAKLAQAAVWLGDPTQTAAQRVEQLTRALITGRTQGLIPYNIDIDVMKARVKDLQAANSGLTASEALTQAFMEGAGGAMQRVQAEGGKSVTSMQALGIAWENLKDAVGEKIYPTVEVLVNVVTGAVKGATALVGTDNWAVSEAAAEAQMTTTSGMMASALANVKMAQDALNYARSVGASDLDVYVAGEKEAIRQYEVLQTRLAGAEAGFAPYMDFVGLATERTNAYGASLIDAKKQVDALQADALEASYPNLAKALDNWTENYLTRQRTYFKAQSDTATDAQNRIGDATKKAAATSQSAWDSAFSAMKSNASSFIDTAREASKALTPEGAKGGEDWLAPGSNGPFENLFRAKDVATRGDASQWAAVLGMDQATAQKVVAEFEAGIMSAGVEALIDKQAIVDRVKLQKIAETTQAAFAEEIARAAGASTATVDQMLGFTDDKISTAGVTIGTKVAGAIEAQDGTIRAAGAAMAASAIDGISAQDQGFYSKGWDQADLYMKGYADRMGSHSPSREMMKLGRSALEGFAIGASGGAGQGPIISGISGGSRRGGADALVMSSRFYQGDMNTYNIYSEGAMAMALGMGRASKARRLSAG